MKKDGILKPGIVLFLICAVMAGFLAYFNSLTAPLIEKAQAEERLAAKSEVLPEADGFTELTDKVTAGTKNGETVGYTAEVSPLGYGGEINMTVGVSADFKVTGIKITSMSETSGLGSRANEPDFLNQFKGKDETVTVSKNKAEKDSDIIAISGATVTSKAVAKGTAEAVELVREAVK